MKVFKKINEHFVIKNGFNEYWRTVLKDNALIKIY